MLIPTLKASFGLYKKNCCHCWTTGKNIVFRFLASDRSRRAWSRVRLWEFGEVCLIAVFFYLRALTPCCCLSSDEGNSHRRRPAGRAVERGGTGHVGMGEPDKRRVEAWGRTSDGAGSGGLRRVPRRGATIRYVYCCLCHFLSSTFVSFSTSTQLQAKHIKVHLVLFFYFICCLLLFPLLFSFFGRRG